MLVLSKECEDPSKVEAEALVANILAELVPTQDSLFEMSEAAWLCAIEILFESDQFLSFLAKLPADSSTVPVSGKRQQNRKVATKWLRISHS